MIRVNILNRANLTMLAKAYMDNLLPKGKQGEVFYDNDEMNEIKFIYFKNQEYFTSLLDYININSSNFRNSNAATEWENLFNALSNYSTVDQVDFGKLEHYTITESSDEQPMIDESILIETTINSDSFLINMKRLYAGYEVTYWGSENFVVIKLPFKADMEFKFDLKPAVDLLNKYGKNLETFNLFRDPKRYLTVVRIGIKEK